MTGQLRYDGKVAIVTGAGNGLGRTYALMLGARGAKVVVNDLGGGMHGDGRSSSAADKVVAEIEALGGQAVANYDSVEHGDKIVQTALGAFGTVDIVINNAGILRDVSFQKMSQEDWDLILRVHLSGTKSVTQAAWPILRDKGYGRIVMTTSAAGIYGNFGQANYCAAKLGIHGLAQCLAEEGRSKNILVNTIAPIAASRLTETVMPPDLLEKLRPEYIAPLVLWLVHESFEETKGLYEVGAGYYAKLRWERTRGYAFGSKDEITPDDVAAKWSAITDFTDAEHPSAVNDTLGALMAALNAKRLGGNELIDLDVAAKQELVLQSSYDERDLALYALGVGAARDPMDATERKFVYEMGDFLPLPTYGVMPQMNAMLAKAKEGTLQLPGMSFGFERLLHGEQYTELKGPLPRTAKLKHVFKVKAAYDKDPNAVVVFGVSSIDESGEELVYNEMTAFVKGAGGWGGDRGPSGEINTPPDRDPDFVIEEKTDPNQTLLYRLSGDWNPLHADPAFAKAFGYDKPILHGLCTYGYVGRHVIKAVLDNDPRKFKSIKVRFADPVFPGETLVTRIWKESGTRVIVEMRAKERDEVVIKNAAVELHAQIPVIESKPKATVAAAAAEAAPKDERLLPADVFAVIREFVAAHPELVEKTKTVFQFKVSNPDSDWVLDLKNGKGEAREGSADKADVTLELAAEHLPTLVTSSLAEVQKLFFGGQLKISGNVMGSNKLTVLQQIDAKKYEEAKAKRLGGATAPSSAPVPAPAPSARKPAPKAAEAPAIFAERLASHGQVGPKDAVLQFDIRAPEGKWTIDFEGARPRVSSGAVVPPCGELSRSSQERPGDFPMKRRVNVIGVGMTKFTKPGQSPEYYEMAGEAGRNALADAGVAYDEIEQAYVGYVYGDSTCGQRGVYELGLTGIPVVNVNNNCSTGSSALYLARQAIEGGVAECVLALGFEKMEKGALGQKFEDRESPLGQHVQVVSDVQGIGAAPPAAQMFGGAGREYRWTHGTKRETFGKIAVKARQHASNNPYALFNQKLSLEEIMDSAEVFDPLTRYQCCPPTCGAAAAVLCSDAFAKKHGVRSSVYIAAQAMTTDYSSSFEPKSMIKMVGYDMTKRAAEKVYEESGIGPDGVQVVELHDCFTANELLTYEGLGLCPEGGAEKFIWDADNTYGGKVVTNPSGGLLSKGHPLGATGLAQCTELVWQLRGQAEKRQVQDARVALQHNLGLGGACVVTMYRRD